MPLHDTKQFDVLGTTPPRADAYEKVTGRARYTADMHLPDMLYGGGKSAGIASGRIVSIDASRARAIPGVRCVLTPADVKKHVSCSSHRYITDRPRFCGDLVALVAAESPTLVQQALDAIAVQYEAYPAVLTIRDALAPDAPRVRDEYQDNRFTETHYSIRKGDVEAAFARCDVILEREYETQCAEHVYIEPEAALAYCNPADGLITVHCCCAGAHTTPAAMSPIFWRSPSTGYAIVQETIGGTFGGKEDGLGMLAARTAYLSRITGRPVKWAYSREESIERTGKRHPFLLRYKAGATCATAKFVAWQGDADRQRRSLQQPHAFLSTGAPACPQRRGVRYRKRQHRHLRCLHQHAALRGLPGLQLPPASLRPGAIHRRAGRSPWHERGRAAPHQPPA